MRLTPKDPPGFADYPLSVRAINVLAQANIKTPYELSNLTKHECSKLRRCGIKTVAELHEILRSEKLEFRREVTVKQALKPYLDLDRLDRTADIHEVLEGLREALAIRLPELMKQVQKEIEDGKAS